MKLELTRTSTTQETITLPAFFTDKHSVRYVAIFAPDHMLEVHKFTDKHNICVGPVPEHFTLNDLLRIQESQFWYAVNPSIDAIRETRTEHLTAEPIAFTVHDKDVVIHDAIRPFQVGDVVKVGKFEDTDKVRWDSRMEPKVGYFGVVESLDTDTFGFSIRFSKDRNDFWYYPASALTLVKPAQ
jgi:hypothetical protein